MLLDAAQDAASDTSIRAVIFTGTDDAFIRHYSVDDIIGAGEALAAGAVTPADFESGGFADLVDCIAGMPKPVIAAINGVCMGGGFELALACDIRVAAEAVPHIGLPETRIGIFPGGGGTQRLPRVIGEAAAVEFILRGKTVDAESALTMGLVHEVAPDAVEHALSIAAEFGERGAEGVAAAKALVRSAFNRPMEQGLKTERRAFAEVLGAQSAMDSMRAFVANADQDITK